jgi:hypothetical protein
MARSRISGVSKLRKTLRRMPETVTVGVKKEVKSGADRVASNIQVAAPASSIRENITAKLARDGLTATIGLHGKRAARRGFLARIFEFGAKPHVIVPRAEGKRKKKRRAAGKVVGGTRVLVTKEGVFLGKSVNHPGMKARPFFFKTFLKDKGDILTRIKKAIGQAVRTASNG